MITLYTLSAFHPAVKGIIRDIRVVWTLEELGIIYVRKVMDPMKREHKESDYIDIHPFGKVPAIKDGDMTLFESSAICSYLGDKVSRLIPMPGSRERVIYDQWVAFTISTLEPFAGRVFALDNFAEKEPSIQKMRDEHADLVEGFIAALDKHLSKKPYLMGTEFTIVDILLSCVSRFIIHTEIPGRFEHFRAYLDRNFARPGFQKALSINGEISD